MLKLYLTYFSKKSFHLFIIWIKKVNFKPYAQRKKTSTICKNIQIKNHLIHLIRWLKLSLLFIIYHGLASKKAFAKPLEHMLRMSASIFICSLAHCISGIKSTALL